MVDAMLFIGRTGCQWRYLPARYGTWTAVWAQWRRWRSNGVSARVMERLAGVSEERAGPGLWGDAVTGRRHRRT
jgi:transposase